MTAMKITALLLLKQKMEFASNKQIEEELRRALNLNRDQPALNSRQSKASSYASTTTSLQSGDVRHTHIGSCRIASSPQNTFSSSSSPAGAAEKIPTASSSSPSINNSKQASCVSGAGASRRRKPRHRKRNILQNVPHDAAGVDCSAGNGKSQKSAVAAKPGSPRIDALETTNTVSRDNTRASSAGLSTSGSSPSTVAGVNSRNDENAGTRTVTEQRASKASIGRGSTKRASVPTVPDRSVQAVRSVDHTHDVATSHVALPGHLLSTDSNISVKPAPLPTAGDKVMNLSTETTAKVAQNTVKPPAKKHEKGKVLCS